MGYRVTNLILTHWFRPISKAKFDRIDSESENRNWFGKQQVVLRAPFKSCLYLYTHTHTNRQLCVYVCACV